MADNNKSTSDEKKRSQVVKLKEQSTTHKTTQTVSSSAKKEQSRSPEEIEKAKIRKAKRERKKKRKKVRRIILSYLFIIIVLIGVIGGYIAYEKFGKDILTFRNEAIELVANSSIDTFRQDETSVVYDAKGKKIREVTGEKEVYYKTYDEIPAYFVEAMVSVEDRRFYEHNGVDYEEIGRAHV